MSASLTLFWNYQIMKKLLLFGAGKIGRSFIAQIFSKDGYEIIFVDISQSIVDRLNLEKRYPVYIKDQSQETLWVENVRALHSSQQDEIIEEISKCQLIAVSVGRTGLPSICETLSKGIMLKYELSPQNKTDIIVAENLRDADLYMRKELMLHLPGGFPIEKVLGIQETSIGKMVPIIPEEITQQDPLAVYAEAYNNLIVSSGFLNGIPQVATLSPKQNIKAWVDRKLFIHNLGHSVAAYVGNFLHPEKVFIHEVLQDDKVEKAVRTAMYEAAIVLQNIYPGEFSDEHLESHINDLINRFRNVALGDTVFRVGCDLERKLSYDDRFMSPIRHALQFNHSHRNILYGYLCSLHFTATSDQGNSFTRDIEIVREYQDLGIQYILQKYSGLTASEASNLEKEFQQLAETININLD
jgi:mannitol-1-phosphate 5-dehydrogenase